MNKNGYISLPDLLRNRLILALKIIESLSAKNIVFVENRQNFDFISFKFKRRNRWKVHFLQLDTFRDRLYYVDFPLARAGRTRLLISLCFLVVKLLFIRDRNNHLNWQNERVINFLTGFEEDQLNLHLRRFPSHKFLLKSDLHSYRNGRPLKIHKT